MAHVVAIGDPVEVEEHGVEPGTQDQTALCVPGEGWLYLARLIDMTHISGEGRHVAGGIGEFQHRVADDLGSRFWAEANGLVALRRNDRELLVLRS